MILQNCVKTATL